MSVLTLIAVTTITPGPNGTSDIKVALTWPVGDTQRHTLDHDWGHDMWDWRGGRMPTSLTRLLRDWGLMLHGERSVYVSPSDVGVDSNEASRVCVYEIDYEG